MRKMKAPCRLLMIVNRYAMMLAMEPIWKMPSTQEQPKMKIWAMALKVSNLEGNVYEMNCPESLHGDT